jgi:hypothetical protein
MEKFLFVALRRIFFVGLSTSMILQHLKLVAKQNSSDETIMALRIILWKIKLSAYIVCLGRILDCTIFCNGGSEELLVLLELLETFRADSQLISVVFQVLLVSIRPENTTHAHLLDDSGIEKCVIDIIESVDDYYVGF